MCSGLQPGHDDFEAAFSIKSRQYVGLNIHTVVTSIIQGIHSCCNVHQNSTQEECRKSCMMAKLDSKIVDTKNMRFVGLYSRDSLLQDKMLHKISQIMNEKLQAWRVSPNDKSSYDEKRLHCDFTKKEPEFDEETVVTGAII